VPEARRDGTGRAYEVQAALVNSSNPVIFDVGAHVGAVATAYRRIFPDALIHCFEPFPESFAKLSQSTEGEPRTSCHRLAVSATNGESILNANASSATNSLLPVDERASGFWEHGVLEHREGITVRSTTLDAFCEAQGINFVDILKLDVQGGEYAVLEGAGKLLSQQRIGLVYMEVILVPTYRGQRSLREYLDVFDANGYWLHDFYNPVRSKSRLLQVDLIFSCVQTASKGALGV
jgi:FkbM family methyltransferase